MMNNQLIEKGAQNGRPRGEKKCGFTRGRQSPHFSGGRETPLNGYKNFVTPLTIMAPIPLTLVGILPAHYLFCAFFSATSMIGFIAGAGIIVRNSIILVDFIQAKMSEGLPLAEAVVEAGAVRFRPVLLIAAAVEVGAGVILFDPIFQGLAISLMAGEVASTLLARVAVPVLFYVEMSREQKQELETEK